jgi:hypothetical protein
MFGLHLVSDAIYRRWLKRSRVEDALQAFAAGEVGTFGPHLRTDGHALWCQGCSVPIALIVCHDCHNAMRLDPIRFYQDPTVAARKLRVWSYLAYLEAMVPAARIERASIIAETHRRLLAGEIEPCPQRAGEGRIFH